MSTVSAIRSQRERSSRIREISGRLRGPIARLRRSAWRLEGRERHSGAALAMVFAGDKESRNYFAHLAFAATPRQIELGRRWIWDVSSKLGTSSGCADEADLTIVQTEAGQRRWLQTRPWFHIPCWIDGEIDLEETLGHFQKSRHDRNEINRVRREGYTWEVATSANAFDVFYSRMYLPYMAERHGNRRLAMTHEEMMAARERCELVTVKLNGEPVSGCIVVYENGGVRAWSKGAVSLQRSSERACPLKALDFFQFTYLVDKGFTRLHMGGSRPFLKDGVLRYKKRLGMRLVAPSEREFALHAAPGSPGAQAFLLNNPFVHERGGELVGGVFVEGQKLSAEEVRRAECELWLRGLRSLDFRTAPRWEKINHTEASA